MVGFLNERAPGCRGLAELFSAAGFDALMEFSLAGLDTAGEERSA
jgi:hypothetical protein